MTLRHIDCDTTMARAREPAQQCGPHDSHVGDGLVRVVDSDRSLSYLNRGLG